MGRRRRTALSRTCSYEPVATGCADEALVEAIRNAEESAFSVLYERYFQRIYTFSFTRLRNHADTEEAVQETFTSVFRSIDAYRGESPLVSWIYGIARNTVNNRLRRASARNQRMARARTELLRASVAMSPGTPEDELNLQRSVDRVRDCLASLSAWQAEVFALRHVENLPIREIARRTSRSHDSVRSSLYRVKSLLIKAVDPSDSNADPGGALDAGADRRAAANVGSNRGGGER
jgi:RNA polymerase sigma-70 factor (ECF subfamily)